MCHKEQGSILVFTVMTVAVLMIIGVSYISLASAEYMANTAHSHRLQAFYEADGGLTYARQYVRAHWQSITTSFNANNQYVIESVPLVDQPVAPLTVITRVSDTQWRLESTGRYGRAIQTVFRDITVQSPTAPGGSVGASLGIPDFDQVRMDAAMDLITNGSSLTVTSSDSPVYLRTVGATGNPHITLTADDPNKDIVIFINRLDMQSNNGRLRITPGTRVRIIIVDYFNYNPSVHINSVGPQSQLHIYPYSSTTNLNGRNASKNTARQKYFLYPTTFVGSSSPAPEEPPTFGHWSGN